MKNKKDRALDTPAEANRDKNINYFEQETHGEYVKNSKALQKRMRKSASSSG
jgi:predicted HAD superfamily phosphohydrolase